MSTLKQQLLVAQQIFADTEIPTMPKEVLELTNLFALEEFPDINKIQNIISENTSLVAELIKVANHKQFISPRKTEVISIRDAIDVIGLTRLKNLVISIGYQLQNQNPSLREISEFNLYTAKVASEIAFYVEGVSEDEAYLAGLFHNAGTLLFSAKFKNYDAIFQETIGLSYSANNTEKAHFKTSHTIAGLLVAKQWQLDNIFNQVILMHHQVDLGKIANDKARSLIAVVQLAIASVTKAIYVNHSHEEAELMQQNSLAELMIEPELIEEIQIAIASEL